MRSITGNVRRATQDMDLDFVRYSLADEAIDRFLTIINCLDGVSINRVGEIEELKQQDYRGKRIFLMIEDTEGTMVKTKMDLGVHTKLDIEQEKYCFDIAFDDEGASLLINSFEQMITEKLRSLLKFGPVSTRYKDIFDIYYLSRYADKAKMRKCLEAYIYSDIEMRENNISDIIRRAEMAFNDNGYRKMLNTTRVNWLDAEIDEVLNGIIVFVKNLE